MYTQGDDDDDDDDDDEWLGSTHYAGGTKREPLRTFTMPGCGKTLSVEQRPPQDGAALWESGSGAVVWEAASAAIAHLDATYATAGLLGKRCLELGSGSGLCGLACAALGAERTTLTDLPEALPLLRSNAAASAWASVVDVRELCWGDAAAVAGCTGADLVVCVDCVYQPEHYEALAATLQALDARRYLVAWVERGRGEEALLSRLQSSFACEPVVSEGGTMLLWATLRRPATPGGMADGAAGGAADGAAGGGAGGAGVGGAVAGGAAAGGAVGGAAGGAVDGAAAGGAAADGAAGEFGLGEQAAYALAELISFELSAAALRALSGCSQAMQQAAAAALGEARRGAELEARLELGATTSWGAACCRRGARRLSVNGEPVTHNMRLLVRWAALSGVAELKLKHACIGAKGTRVLAAAGARGDLDGLRVLDLSHNFIGDGCVELLCEHALRPGPHSGFRRLRVLNLSSNAIADRGLHTLCAAVADGALGSLATLRIAANDIGAEPIQALAAVLAGGALGALTELVVPTGQERSPALKGACSARGLKLV